MKMAMCVRIITFSTIEAVATACASAWSAGLNIAPRNGPSVTTCARAGLRYWHSISRTRRRLASTSTEPDIPLAYRVPRRCEVPCSCDVCHESSSQASGGRCVASSTALAIWLRRSGNMASATSSSTQRQRKT